MNYQKLKEEREERNLFARYLGIQITDMSFHHAEASMKIIKEYFNPNGSVHGGCLYTISDVVCGAAASTCGYDITTLNSDFHYLKAVKNTGNINAVAECVRAGRTIQVYEARVYDDSNILLANGIFTYMILQSSN